MRTLLTTLHSKYIHPSLALPCLAAYCGQECGELKIAEYTIHQPKENLLAQLLKNEPDVICFSIYIWNRQLSLELAASLKLAEPQIRIVLGGPEVSFEMADFFDVVPVDALICGEGERPLKNLLLAWKNSRELGNFPGLQLPGQDFTAAGQSFLASLDELPSPFAAGLVDLSRGYVYYESSRGCPYHCSFCMSALDEQVRSFSMERILQDLSFLMEKEVSQIKFVDRTFNYDATRSCEIIEYILQHNRRTHFHFEIGADLLNESLLTLLEKVPQDMFQFEIGVQTTKVQTLDLIGRKSSLEKLEENVSRLRRCGNIHLHLDLIAGLPGESRIDSLASLTRILALRPHHLQIELVKLLPGAPLRKQAAEMGIIFDPAPPYVVLKTPDLSYVELEELRGIGRLVDLIGNSSRFMYFLESCDDLFETRTDLYCQLQTWWQRHGLFDAPLSMLHQFDALYEFSLSSERPQGLITGLGRDFSLAGRVVPGKTPLFLNSELTPAEKTLVTQRVKLELDDLPAGEKLQHFATIFTLANSTDNRQLVIYLYRSGNGKRPTVEEVFLPT